MADLFDILLAKNLAGGGVHPQGEIEITENGEYDVAEYATADVDVPSPFPVTVTFMNGDEEWAKVGVDGEGKIAEPSTPISPIETPYFVGWFDGENKISFPYEPTESKTIAAIFTSERKEMEYITTGETMFEAPYNNMNVVKSNDGICICGYRTNVNNSYDFICVAKTQEACMFSVKSSDTPTISSFNYDNEIYYMCRPQYTYSTRGGCTPYKSYYLGYFETYGRLSEVEAKALLDYYYRRTD